MKKLLLTAFEPFGGKVMNASQEVANSLADLSFAQVQLEVLILPVSRFEAVDIMLQAMAALKPDVILMLGESGGRFQVTPERVAINADDFIIPDNTGHQPQGEPINPQGPVGYFSGLPIYRLVQKLRQAGIPAAISDTAGLYLCNRLFYRVMEVIAHQQLPIKAGFIHVPYLHEQVIGHGLNVPSLSRATLVQAMQIVIEVCLADH